MKSLKVLILMIAFLNATLLYSQVTRSKTSSIRISNAPAERQIVEVPVATELKILYPSEIDENKFQSFESELNLIGQVNSAAGINTILLNGESVTLNDAGVFSANVTLERGINKLTFIVIDNSAQIIEKTIEIEYGSEEMTLAEKVEMQSKYYGLIIGIDNYEDIEITNLDNPVRDARQIYNILQTRYTFSKENLMLLENARREDITNALDELSEKLSPDDNLLIFYAGHGTWDEESNVGYWLPSDAHRSRKSAWFRNSTLVDYLKEIDCRHTLLITDACFAGAIFKSRSAFADAPKAIDLLYDLPSRKAMTSGTLTEVPDRSVFMQYFLNRLNNNTSKYISAEELFSSFRIAVINNSNVVPQFGEIKGVGDEGGDFIFILKE